MTVEPRNPYASGGWKWGRTYFQADGVLGTTPQFTADLSDSYSPYNAGHRFYYSYDQVNWTMFDNGSTTNVTYNQGLLVTGEYHWSNGTAFTQDSVYIASEIPYTMGRTVSHTASLVSSPWVHQTASGNASLVVANTTGSSGGGLVPAYVDDLGRNVASQPIYGFKITDAASALPKTKVVIMSGNHSGETYGNYAVEGLIDFLVGGSTEAAALRQVAEFYIYPQVDPEGRAAGYFRSSTSNRGRNHNRVWGNYYPASGYGVENPEIALTEAAILADTGGSAEYFLDFHDSGQIEDSYPLLNNNLFNQTNSSTPGGISFRNAMANRDPEHSAGTRNYQFHTGYSQGWADTDPLGLGATYSGTPELHGQAAGGIARFMEVGENYGLVFHDVLVPEPATMSLLALGGLAMLRRKRN